MKRLIIVTILALVFGMNLSAQSDGFFKSNYSEYRETEEWGGLPVLPGAHGLDYDYDAAPLGSGLIILGGLALAYRRMRRKD